MSWVTLSEFHELREGRGYYAEIDGFELAVFLHQGVPYTLDSQCPHAGASLAGGEVEDGCAVCPLHAWAFRLTDGTLRGSGGVAVRTYPTRVLEREGKRFVQANLPMY